MTRKTSRTRVDGTESSSYAAVGSEFFRAADLARQHSYWNAAGLLFVHASIAYADAVCIAKAACKSSSDNHHDAADLLRDVAPQSKERGQAIAHFERVLEEKNLVAYSGDSFRTDDVEKISKHAARFRAWAEGVLREAKAL